MPGKWIPKKVTLLYPPLASFVPQMQLTALLHKTPVGSEHQDLTSNEVDSSNGITVIEEKLSKLDVTYKENRHELKQQKSISD